MAGFTRCLAVYRIELYNEYFVSFGIRNSFSYPSLKFFVVIIVVLEIEPRNSLPLSYPWSLTCGPPASASRVARITGVQHCSWPEIILCVNTKYFLCDALHFLGMQVLCKLGWVMNGLSLKSFHKRLLFWKNIPYTSILVLVF